MLLVALTLAPSETAVASAPCALGTPSALRFAGLPDRVAIGRTDYFSLDFDHEDWYVEGDIQITMASGGNEFFRETTDDSLADLWLRLDPGDRDATVTATFEQVTFADDDTAFYCVQTVSRTVTAFTAPVRLICNRWDFSGENIPYRTNRPRRCSIWRENWAHYQSASFIKARWRGWGRLVAPARGTLTYNMGYRAPVRIKAYRLRFDCTGRYRVYTRVLIKGPDGHGVVSPDTCA
jgi:hypothetical protein